MTHDKSLLKLVVNAVTNIKVCNVSPSDMRLTPCFQLVTKTELIISLRRNPHRSAQTRFQHKCITNCYDEGTRLKAAAPEEKRGFGSRGTRVGVFLERLLYLM
jgi:hypothetical protein